MADSVVPPDIVCTPRRAKSRLDSVYTSRGVTQHRRNSAVELPKVEAAWITMPLEECIHGKVRRDRGEFACRPGRSQVQRNETVVLLARVDFWIRQRDDILVLWITCILISFLVSYAGLHYLDRHY